MAGLPHLHLVDKDIADFLSTHSQALFLTPNERAVSGLHRAYSRRQTAPAWLSPSIMSLQVWLTESWLAHCCLVSTSSPKLLTEWAEKAFWEDIISEDPAPYRSWAMAELAYEAWQRQAGWGISTKTLETFEEPDTKCYIHWLHRYQDRLKNYDYLDRATLLDHLQESTLWQQKPYQALYLVNFVELVPQLEHFLHKLTRFIPVVRLTLTAKADSFHCGLASYEEEWQHAASLAARDSDAETLIIVPDLAQHRPHIQRVMTSLPTQYNISAPPALLDYPMIAAIFTLLKLISSEFQFEDFSFVIRSPFFFPDLTRAAKDRLDWICRQRLEACCCWSQLFTLLGTQPDYADFTQQLQTFRSMCQHLKIQSATLWVSWLRHILETIGWPGNRRHTSTEYQVHHQWFLLLDEYVALNDILGAHSFTNMHTWISRLAQYKTFLPEVRGAQVQVLGLLEAAGLLADNIWFAQCDRNSWPQAAAPNPLLPLNLQHHYHMPRSHPERELVVAQKLTKMIQQSARSTVVFSYAREHLGQTHYPSPLIASLPVWPTHPVLPTYKKQIPLEKTKEQEKIKYTQEYVPLGTQALQARTQCAFQAFALIRLKAQPCPTPTLGLTALDRGILTHSVLQSFWQYWRSQERALKAGADTRATVLKNCITNALQAYQYRKPMSLRSPFLGLEQDRLYYLLTPWIDTELHKPPFEVLSCEQRLWLRLGPLKFQVRLDRLDQTATGLWVIDYKTGRITLDDRTTLQLALYSLATPGVTAALLAGIPEKIYRGWAPADTLSSSVNPWNPDLLPTWQAELNTLAELLQQGSTALDPRHGVQTCAQCSYAGLCKKAQTQLS